MFKQAEYIFDSKQRVFVSIIFLQEVKELQIFFLMGNKRSCHGYGKAIYSSLPPPAKTQVFQITFVSVSK